MARQMKDSGIEWIGEIPIHFQKYRIKNVAELHGRIGFRGYTTDDLVGAGEGPITLSPSNIKDMSMNYVKCSYISWAKYDESPEIQVHNGDILMVKTGSSYGKSALVTALPMEATINPQLIVISDFKVVSQFLNYYFHTEIIQSQVENAVVGGTIPTMAQEKINNFFFFAPTFAEQHRIADFLDRKCAEIDAIIEKTKATIEEYKKLKQSVITEAVTKGIRGNRPMKDSGIGWIGEIPEDWGRMKLKYIIDTLNSGAAITNDKLTDADDKNVYPVFGGGSLIGFYHDFNVEHALLVGRVGAKCGCITLVPGKAWATDNALIVKTKWNIEWLNYVLIASDLNKLNTSNAQPLITASKVLNLYVAVCEEMEQQEIVGYLNDKCVALDNLITKKTALLTELENYKKSVIYEYVTGKKTLELQEE